MTLWRKSSLWLNLAKVNTASSRKRCSQLWGQSQLPQSLPDWGPDLCQSRSDAFGGSFHLGSWADWGLPFTKEKCYTWQALFVCHQMEREGPGQSKTLGRFFRSSFWPFLIHVVIATQGSGNVIFSSSMSQIHSQWMMSSPLQGFWATLVPVSHLSQRNAADADRKLHECGPLSH